MGGCSERRGDKVTSENYLETCLRFGDRQAGVSLVYDAAAQAYTYNVYCFEITLLQELFTVEYDDLEDALALLAEEFKTWTLVSFDGPSRGCGDCAAKKSTPSGPLPS